MDGLAEVDTDVSDFGLGGRELVGKRKIYHGSIFQCVGVLQDCSGCQGGKLGRKQ